MIPECDAAAERGREVVGELRRRRPRAAEERHREQQQGQPGARQEARRRHVVGICGQQGEEELFSLNQISLLFHNSISFFNSVWKMKVFERNAAMSKQDAGSVSRFELSAPPH